MDVEELINRGCRKHQAEMYEEAIEDFSAAIKLDPKDAWAYYFRGYAYFELKKFDVAIKDITKAINIDPFGSFFSTRGRAYNFQGNHGLAIKDYTTAIKLEERAFDYEQRGRTYYIQGNYKAAIKDYTAAIKLEENAYYFCDRGDAYYELENYEAAIKDYTSAINLLKQDDPVSAECSLLKRGQALFFNGQYEDAISDLEKVITDESEMDNKINGFRWLGHVYDHLEEFDKAESYFSLAIENANDDDENKGFVYHMYSCRATTRFNMEKYQLCLSDVEKILLEYPDREDCLQLQKDALAEMEKSSAKKTIKDDSFDACCAADESYF